MSAFSLEGNSPSLPWLGGIRAGGRGREQGSMSGVQDGAGAITREVL